MSSRIIYKGIASGKVTAPPSKSYAHRYLIGSFLASVCGGTSVIRNIALSEDISATLDCIKALGGNYSFENGTVTVRNVGVAGKYSTDGQDEGKRPSVEYFPTIERTPVLENSPLLNCRESGSTLRFFIPIVAALTGRAILCGTEKLISRGIGVYEKIFAEQGIGCTKYKNKIIIDGTLKSGRFTVDGNISSQFITGLLFALPLLDGDSDIEILPPVQSRPYIEITLDVLSKFGIKVCFNENYIHIPGNQKYVPIEHVCEGDFSNAAFLDSFNYLGGNVEVAGLDEDSKQGDKVYGAIFKRLSEGYCTVDLADCIDLGPVLFIMAAAKHGARFINTARLRIKESDRVADVCEELSKIGVKCRIEENEVDIQCFGESAIMSLQGKDIVFDSHNDHRIAMSLSVLSTLFTATVKESDAVRKSYPDFYADLASLNIEIKEI